MNRRDALKILAAGSAAAAVPAAPLAGQPLPVVEAPAPVIPRTLPAVSRQQAKGPRGTPTDPDLVRPTVWWPLVLTADELATIAALCDVIIPADEHSPAASTVGAPAYINEHVSAPYPGQRRELVTVRGGLVWLDTEAQKRFQARFRDASVAQQTAICEDIHYLPEARPEFQFGARFFALMRNLTSTAFYSTPEGMRDIGYRGNTPQAAWNGPPPEVLRHLGLAEGE